MFYTPEIYGARADLQRDYDKICRFEPVRKQKVLVPQNRANTAPCGRSASQRWTWDFPSVFNLVIDVELMDMIDLSLDSAPNTI